MKFYLKENSVKVTKSVTDSNPSAPATAPRPLLIMGRLYDAQFVGSKGGKKGGRFVYSTGEKILPNKWDLVTGKPKKGQESLQIRLNKISSAAADYIRDNRESLTQAALKAHLDKLRPKEVWVGHESDVLPKTMLELWQEFLDAIKDTVLPGSHVTYTRSREVFDDFLKENKLTRITPEVFTVTEFKRYEGYCKKNFKPNTVAKLFKHFKAFLTHVIKLKIVPGFDLDEIKYKETAGLKISLSNDELQKFIDADLSEDQRLDRVRDLWVVQCSLGPRISDLKRIDQSIVGGKIKLETQKNRKGIEIPIPPAVRAILEKRNYELPKMSEQKYRKGIKDLYAKFFPDNVIQIREGNTFKTVPVHEEISSHDAVRTFITLSHAAGMSVNSIAQITGKSVKVLLKHYLVENQQQAEKEFEKAWGASPLKVAR
jgi:integrase